MSQNDTSFKHIAAPAVICSVVICAAKHHISPLCCEVNEVQYVEKKLCVF